ncbi:MAG: hypothetical protein KDE20_22565, partial [Caldilineaceae bacterium]|nr:hypothetical protein [Caldilineaceae bacterium]
EPAPTPSPAPAPAPQDERQPGWENNADATPPPAAVIPMPELGGLHVLYAVGDSRGESSLTGSPLGTIQASSPLLGEAQAQLPDSLLFSRNSHGEHIGLIRERGFGEVQEVRPDLYVQLAVRHQPISTDPSLWVQHAVRASQLESQLRDASLDANHSATPGYGTLMDPFALGAPQPEGSVVKVSEATTGETHPVTAAVTADAPEVTPTPVKDAEHMAEKPVEKPKAAMGLRQQLQRHAKDRLVSARPITRSTANS